MNYNKTNYRVSFFIIICLVYSSRAFPEDSASFSIPPDTLLAKSYIQRANSFAKLNYSDSAVYYYNEAGNIYGQHQKWEKQIRCKMSVCLVYLYNEHNFTRADSCTIELIKKATEIFGDSGRILVECNIVRAFVMKELARYSSGINYLNTALNIAEKYYEYYHVKTGLIYGNLGIQYSHTGQYQKSLSCYNRALDIDKKLFGENHLTVATNYNNLGVLYANLGLRDSAKVMYHNALSIWLDIFGENHADIANCYNNIAVQHLNQGDFYQAIRYETKALDIRLSVLGEQHPATARSYANLGVYNEFAGNYNEALEFQLQALKIRKSIRPSAHPEISNSYTNIASIYYNQKKYDEALIYQNLALEINEQIYGKQHTDVAEILKFIGNTLRKQGEYDQALENFKQAVQIRQQFYQGSRHPKIAELYYSITNTYMEMEQYDSAFANIHNAIKFNSLEPGKHDEPFSVENKNIFSDQIQLKSLFLKGELYYLKYLDQGHKLSDLKTSVDTYMESIKLMEEIRYGFSSNESKFFLTEESGTIMNKALESVYQLYLETNDKSLQNIMFNLIERSKAGILREMLTNNNATSFSGIPDSLVARENVMAAYINAYKTDIIRLKEQNDSSDKHTINELSNRLFQLETEYNELLVLFETKYPKYKQLKYNSEISSPEIISGQLDKKTVVLNYFVADTSLFIYAIEKDNYHFIHVAIDSIFNKNILEYLKCIKKMRVNEFMKYNRTLYKKMIMPIEHFIKGKKLLVIIPDKDLYYLPFETLCKHIPEDTGMDFRGAEYLIKQYEIIYHYSTSLYYKAASDRDKKISKNNSFIGYAPVFCKDSTNGSILSNTATIIDSSYITDNALRSVSINGITYNELVYSEKEIKTIQSMFNKNGMKASGYFYSKATEDTFRKTAPLNKYVHIASHGFINENNPYLSGIVFSQNDTATDLKSEIADSWRFSNTSDLSSSSDGILFSGEMFDLELNADLVVLSACETGLGKIINGEGVMSMTRGFIYSGALNILYSLWKVGDRNTNELMVQFYSNILNGNTYSGALQKAKLTLINNDKTAFPKFWSGFTLLGIN